MPKFQEVRSKIMTNSVSRRTALRFGVSAAATALLTRDARAASPKRRIVVWSEGTAPRDIYPNDISGAIADGLKKSLPDWEVVLASIDDPGQGASDELLEQTDVLMWWGHRRHREVKNEVVETIFKRVNDEGMGFISLHSSHYAKPYKRLMGTRCSWNEYKADGTSARIIVKEPKHPICQGIKDFELPKIERYGEPFAVPEPEAVPLDGEYTKPDGTKEPGRMGLCWTIGKGRVFYFTPGHETYDDFFRPEVRLILANAVKWAAGK
jgi:trehalose utilization protein